MKPLEIRLVEAAVALRDRLGEVHGLIVLRSDRILVRFGERPSDRVLETARAAIVDVAAEYRVTIESSVPGINQ